MRGDHAPSGAGRRGAAGAGRRSRRRRPVLSGSAGAGRAGEGARPRRRRGGCRDRRLPRRRGRRERRPRRPAQRPDHHHGPPGRVAAAARLQPGDGAARGDAVGPVELRPVAGGGRYPRAALRCRVGSDCRPPRRRHRPWRQNPGRRYQGLRQGGYRDRPGLATPSSSPSVGAIASTAAGATTASPGARGATGWRTPGG